MEDVIRMPAAQTCLDLTTVPVHLAWRAMALSAGMWMNADRTPPCHTTVVLRRCAAIQMDRTLATARLDTKEMVLSVMMWMNVRCPQLVAETWHAATSLALTYVPVFWEWYTTRAHVWVKTFAWTRVMAAIPLLSATCIRVLFTVNVKLALMEAALSAGTWMNVSNHRSVPLLHTALTQMAPTSVSAWMAFSTMEHTVRT